MKVIETKAITKWSIDAINSQIGFSVKYLLFTTVRGIFKEFDGTVSVTGEDFTTAEIDCWINPTSIDTGVEQRDTHLKGSDFFDVEKFDKISFKSITWAKERNQAVHELHGELTIKGIKKQIKLDVQSGGIMKDPWGTEKALFSISGKINRQDWGLNWNAILETGGVLVSEEVSINGEILLIRQS